MNPHSRLVPALVALSFLLQISAPAQNLPANTNRSSARSLKSFIAGGSGNLIGSNSKTSFIGGGQFNSITNESWGSFLGGGVGNTIFARNYFLLLNNPLNFVEMPASATVSGGYYNSAQAPHAVVGGGLFNSAMGQSSVVGGGSTNLIRSNSTHSFIGGGHRNTIQTNSSGSVIAGGVSNIVEMDAPMAVVGGGLENFITNNSTASAIGGGVANTIMATNRPDPSELTTVAAAATIAGGVENTAVGHKSAIGGGWGNITGEGSDCAVVGGGRGNIVLGSYSSIVGGDENQITFGDSSTIVGGNRNKIERFVFLIPERTSGVFIGGGDGNKASADHAVVAGGQSNFSEGVASFIGGGFSNSIGNPVAPTFRSVIGGGGQNSVSGFYGFIGGGDRNTNSGNYATIGGGTVNAARGLSSTVAGGANNTASGENATVGGGYTNVASAYAATIPGGVFCKATHSGSFVWSGDDSETTSSWGDHTFTVRAEGGVRFYTASGTAVGAFLGPNGSWQVASDSNLKTKVTAVDTRMILSKVAAMPLTEWEYKVVPHRRYIGPMSQDFHAAFGLGDDDKTISTLDSDGVMYAAIQGLVEELKDRDKTIDELKTKLESVEQRLNSLPPAP